MPLNPASPRYMHPKYDRPAGFGTNGIFVLESLRPGDKKTGAELARWLKLQCERMGLHFEYISLTSKKSLIKHLNAIRNEAELGLVPILHFELHGDSTGVQVGKDMVSWESLLNLLRTINLVCKHNLFVSFAACQSFYIYPNIDVFKPAPFFGVVGCGEVVSTGSVEVGFQAFFEELFSGFDIGKALAAMNQAIDNPQEYFRGELAQSLFEGLWLMIEDEWNDPKARQKQIHSLMAQALHNINIRQSTTLPELRRFIEDERSKPEMDRRKKEVLDYFLCSAPRPAWYGLTHMQQQQMLL